MKPTNIEVIVDITKDQVLPDSASKLQVILHYQTAIQSYTSSDGETISGDNLVKETQVSTSQAELQAQSDDLQTQLDDIQKRKTELDSLISEVTMETTKAIANL